MRCEEGQSTFGQSGLKVNRRDEIDRDGSNETALFRPASAGLRRGKPRRRNGETATRAWAKWWAGLALVLAVTSLEGNEPAIVWQTASPNGRYALAADFTGETARLSVVSLVSGQTVLELTPPIAVPGKALADVPGSLVVARSWDENEGLVGLTGSDHPGYFWLDLVNGKVIDRTAVFSRALGKQQVALVDAHFINKDALYVTSKRSGKSWDLYFRITGPNEVRYERREPTPDERAPLGESILLARKIERLYQALRGTLNENDRLALTAEQQSWLAEREILSEPEERLPFERDRYTELNHRLTTRLAELAEKAD